MPRPRRKGRIFDSMQAAASALGVSMELLKKLKQDGCPAFSGSRVYETELMEFISKSGAKTGEPGNILTLRDQKIGEEIRKLKLRNDKEDGRLVERAKVADSMRRCLGPITATLEQRLVNEYPTAVAGMSVPDARVFGRRLSDEIVDRFRTFEHEWK